MPAPLCVKCGYSVTGLRPSAVCPECGSPIAEGLTRTLANFYTDAEIARMAHATTLLIRSLIIWGTLNFLATVAAFIHPAPAGVICALRVLVSPFVAYATFRCALPSPLGSWRSRSIDASLARTGAILLALADAIATFLFCAAFFSGAQIDDASAIAMLPGWLLTLGAMFLYALGLTQYIEFLAFWAPHDALARRARRTSWATMILVLVPGPFLVAWALASDLSRMRSVLRKLASVSGES